MTTPGPGTDAVAEARREWREFAEYADFTGPLDWPEKIP